MMIRRIPFWMAHAVLHSFGRRPLPALFIMGHMRCGSTLLHHILLTSPEMIGCGERNSPYRSAADLSKLETAARIAQHTPFRRLRYVVDQINHDHLTPNLELLRDDRVRCIFLVREPRAAIQSILNLNRTFYKPWTAGQAVDYYSRRLQTLMRCAASLKPHDVLAITYDDLVTDTSRTFRRLESFLDLSAELPEQYTIQKFTGKRGDPSEKIRAGHIVRGSAPAPIEIPEGELLRAVRAYEACAHALRLSGFLEVRGGIHDAKEAERPSSDET